MTGWRRVPTWGNRMDVQRRGKPRPALFRALGKDDPPTRISVDGQDYQRLEILKHDSWAATAIYRNEAHTIVCKFNRVQPILLFPIRWLGRLLAARESQHYQHLADLPNVPRGCGPVYADGQLLRNATAHEYVEGHPLRSGERVSDRFFPELIALFEEIHQRNMAYVDLHKRENILVGADGHPFLIDFQISMRVSSRWNPVACWVLRQLQKADRYHLFKHQIRHRPDLYGSSGHEEKHRPFWIRIHRYIGVPFRELRRRLLVLFGVRQAKGRATSEHFAEDAVRQENRQAA